MTDHRSIQCVPFAPKRRIETGALQFEGDWPGYFIRGDNAAGDAGLIAALVAQGDANPEQAWPLVRAFLALHHDQLTACSLAARQTLPPPPERYATASLFGLSVGTASSG